MPTGARGRRWKGILAAAVVVLCGCAAALVLAEVAVRVAAPSSPLPRWFERSERYAYTLKSNFGQEYPFPRHDFIMTVETNAHGLRDAPLDPGAPLAGRSVLLLGDSFVFGFGVNVEQRFDALLEARLDEVPGLRVVNAGVPGWGTVQQVTWARDHLDAYAPDVVVLVFCGNDPHDDMLFTSGQMVFDERGLVPFPGKGLLRQHSHLYRFLLTTTRTFRHNLYLRGRRQEQGEAVHICEQSAGVIDDAGWRRTLGEIRSFHEDFLRFNPEGTMLVLATAPWDTEIRERLSELDNGATLRYVDLYAETAGLSEEERRLPWDGHWSFAVHELVAKRLAAELRPLLTDPAAATVP